MARRKSPFGPNLQKVLELAPVELARSLFEKPKGGSGALVDLTDLGYNPNRKRLAAHVADQEPEVLKQLEDVCRHVIELSEGKGTSSLDTVVQRKMYNTEIDEYEAQKDKLCKSIWVFTRFHDVFLDAQSFHTARRYREHGRLYSAFEVADDVIEVLDAQHIDLEKLSFRMSHALDLKVKTTTTAIDLPGTSAHPKSVMVVVRHGGPLSSILDHKDDGLREPYYYRPANEAILIYTPSLRKLEVCATGYVVRETTSNTFAGVVLGQDVLKKPLANRNFNLDRFRKSLKLPLPEFDDVDIKYAKVTELESRLGNWKRRILLQVTIDDDIEAFADRYMAKTKAAAEKFGYSRVTLVVGYKYRERDESGTLKLWVSSGNRSNAQNDRDPELRDLGLRLLDYWGVMEHQRLLAENERARYFEDLLFLYEFNQDEVPGSILKSAALDCKRLQSAQIIELKGRQEIVLIEEEGDVIEAELDSCDQPGQLSLEGAFGEHLGSVDGDEHKNYRINREYLSEIVLGILKNELGASSARVSNNHIAEFGKVPIGATSVPVYLVRTLGSLEKPEKLDLEFRRRHYAGPGLILASGETAVSYLGSNVVVPLQEVVSISDDGIVLDPDALDHRFREGQALVMASDAPKLIQYNDRHATLHLPGRPPYNFFTAPHITIFQRLVGAANSGKWDVLTKVLMAGLGSGSPQQAFSANAWTQLRGVYISRGEGNSWRLCRVGEAQ